MSAAATLVGGGSPGEAGRSWTPDQHECWRQCLAVITAAIAGEDKEAELTWDAAESTDEDEDREGDRDDAEDGGDGAHGKDKANGATSNATNNAMSKERKVVAGSAPALAQLAMSQVEAVFASLETFVLATHDRVAALDFEGFDHGSSVSISYKS